MRHIAAFIIGLVIGWMVLATIQQARSAPFLTCAEVKRAVAGKTFEQLAILAANHTDEELRYAASCLRDYRHGPRR